MAHAHLDKQLLKQYEALPQTVDYSSLRVINVSPSVVPTYLPSFRVYSYNISKVPYMAKNLSNGAGHRSKPQQCKKDKYRDTWRCNLSKPWHTNPRAPSQSNTRLSALGYAQVLLLERCFFCRHLKLSLQYYMPKLETANETHRPNYRLEYLTYASDMLHALPGQEEFDYPIPLKLLPKALRPAGHGNSKYTPYELRDLTVQSWVGLAKEIADPANKRLRERFREYLWMGKGRG
jgi:endopolyphosphatase